MFAMAGGTRIHSLIVLNLAAEFRQRFRGGPCSTTTQDLRLRVSPGGLYTYPDVMVICGKPEMTDDHLDTAVNPMLLVEVLSPSMENHDRVFKFAQYRRIESLQEYVMVSQSAPHVEPTGARVPEDGCFLNSQAWMLSAISPASIARSPCGQFTRM